MKLAVLIGAPQGASRAKLAVLDCAPQGAGRLKLSVLVGVLLVAACTSQAPEPSLAVQTLNEQESQMEIEQVVLPDLGPAPELQNEIWLNTSQPLRLADLRGSVVLIDMWTFG